jgi:hypothetical protein
MAEPKIINVFPKCKACKSKETVSALGSAGVKERGKMDKDAFTSLKREIVPLEQPIMAGVTVECIVTHFDVCAVCGTERCTKAELVQAPVQMMPGGPAGPTSGFRGFNPKAK